MGEVHLRNAPENPENELKNPMRRPFEIIFVVGL